MKKVFLFLFFLLQVSFGLIELEKGEFDKLLLKFLENKASPLELKVLKAYFQNLGVEVEEYLVYYAKGLMLERQKKLEEALNSYLPIHKTKTRLQSFLLQV